MPYKQTSNQWGLYSFMVMPQNCIQFKCVGSVKGVMEDSNTFTSYYNASQNYHIQYKAKYCSTLPSLHIWFLAQILLKINNY
jgi:hypothetical protein